MSMNSSGGFRQKGFTLIEMSIVLVIIGLIIGGILKGQELINTSRQKNLATQIDAIRAAINTFNDKYSSLPGAFAQATTRIAPQAVNGRGLGVVGPDSPDTATMVGITASVAGGAGGATATQQGEPSAFWCQLSITNLIGGSSSDCATAPTSFGNGSFLPATAYSGAGLSVAYGTADTTTSSNPRDSLWLRMHRTAGTPSAGISGKNMAEIDAKFDDGLPGTGAIRSGLGTSNECPNAAITSTYVVTTGAADQPTCILFADLVK